MSKKSSKLMEINSFLDGNNIFLSQIEHNDSVIQALKRKASTIQDDRHSSYTRHSLVNIIMITIFAVLADCDEWEEIADFAKDNQRWLTKYLELDNGVPSSDTIRVVISNLETKHFYSIVISFLMDSVDHIVGLTKNEKLLEQQDILSIDGKESKGSKRAQTSEKGKLPLHTLNAYSNNYGFCIGQEFIEEKSNEIPAAPILLEQLDLSNSIVTWDALNTQKSTVNAVIKGQGDYVAALKKNHPLFYKEVQEYFSEDILSGLENKATHYYKTRDREHSSVVKREYYITDDISWFADKKDWKKMQTIGMVKKTTKKDDGENRIEIRYYFSSLGLDVELFAYAVRNHWGVENLCHWHLDFTFHDDKNTSMARNGAKNMQIIKKIVLAILRMVQSLYGQSLKRIRKSMARNSEIEITKLFSLLSVDALDKALNSK